MRRRPFAPLVGLLLAFFVGGCSNTDSGGPQRVLLVSIDTLRADALSSYGNPRPTSPNLDALAEDGIRFTHAIAPSPWTLPSHATMLTGQEPDVSAHPLKLVGALPTLAEVLRDRGFATGAVVNFHFLSAKRGFDHGFDSFHFDSERNASGRIVGRAVDFLREHRDESFFLFLHFFDVHSPYVAPAPFHGRFADPLPAEPDPPMAMLRQFRQLRFLTRDVPNLARLRAHYDEGVAWVDHNLGELFGAMREFGLYDDTWIVATSDHGESFFEHAIFVGHGLFVYTPVIRVPLIVKPAGQHRAAGSQDERLTGLIDVPDTILGALGLPPIPGSPGRNLLDGPRETPGDSGYADPAHAPAVFGVSSNLAIHYMRTPDWAYIEAIPVSEVPILLRRKPKAGGAIDYGEQLYDLRTDPGETRNRIDDEPAVAAALRARLIARKRENAALRESLGIDREAPFEVNEEEARALRELGYVP